MKNKLKTSLYFLLKIFGVICLFIGIILNFNRCIKTDFIHTYEFVYINQTDYTLKFEVACGLNYYLVILPQSSSDVKFQSEGGKEMANKGNHQNVLDCLLSNSGKSPIFIDATSCVEFFESGFVDISKYQYKMVGKLHIKYTYIFTEADFIDAKPFNDNTN